MDTTARLIAAHEDVLRAALRCLTAQHADLSADNDAESEYADEQLALAARELTRAVDELQPAGRRPVGWDA